MSVSEDELIRVQHDLTITISDSDAQRCMLRVVGEVDFATSPLLRALLEQQLACGRTYVRVDMSGAAFIDTAGVKVLRQRPARRRRHRPPGALERSR